MRNKMRHLDLFSGIGGFALAASWVWEEEHEIVSFCEIDPFCQKVLKKHWPDVPIISDIREMKGSDFVPIDLLTGGFPCQPFSTAGKRKGKADDRFLWPEMLRVISEAKPSWIIGENVSGIASTDYGMVVGQIKDDLGKKGYRVLPPIILPACSVGALHRRDRFWFLAHSMRFRSSQSLQPIQRFERSEKNERIKRRQREFYVDKPEFLRMVDGLSSELDYARLKALGNAIVPQVAQVLMTIIKGIP